MSELTEKQNIDFQIKEIINKISKHYLESDNVVDYSSYITNNGGNLEISDNIEDMVLNKMLHHIIMLLQSEIQKNNGRLYSIDILGIETAMQDINSKIDKWIIENCYNRITIQDINELSNLSYESTNCAGNIVLLNEKQDDISCDVRFCEDEYDTSFEFSGKKLKFIRKLLEVTNEKLYLVLKHTDKNTWKPIGYSTEHKNHKYPRLSIKGKSHWEFFASNKKVLFSQGKYVISDDKDQLLENELNKLIQVNNNIDLNSLKELVKKSKNLRIFTALYLFF